MPNYTFEDTETGEQFVEFMSMDSKEQFLKDNPNFRFVFVPVGLPGDHLMGVGPKETTQFKERMGQIAEKHPYSPLATKYGNRSTKETKINDSRERVGKKVNRGLVTQRNK